MSGINNDVDNRYPKIIDELYGGKITVVQLVLTIPNPIDFVKNYNIIIFQFYVIGEKMML